MGLFDFALDMGKKLFGNEDDPAEKIKEAIEEVSLDIEDLSVDFEDGKVALSGKAASVEAMEKAVLIAGNVQGVSEVSAEGMETPPQPQEPKVEYYVIVKGDTLSGIAKRFLGNAMDYPKIFEANREVIKDPDLIYPGQKIRIPME
jgi:nucleoid-associated protein YgaU